MRAALLAGSLSLLACVRLGFDGRTDGAADVLPTADHPVDVRPVDAIRDLAPQDLTTDLGPCSLDAGCGLCGPPSNLTCSIACPAGDCDEMPDARDPWPTDCNPVLLYDDFSTCSGWDVAAGAEHVQCRWCSLELAAPPDSTIVSQLKPTLAPALAGTSFLVEARLFVPGSGEPWGFLVDSSRSSDGTQYARCRLERQTGCDKLVNVVSAGGSRNPTNSGCITLGNPPGGLVLQGWMSGGFHYCSVVDGATPLATLGQTTVGMSFADGTLELAFANMSLSTPQTLRVSALRVFAE